MSKKVENAVVKRTQLGIEDHGILTAFLHVGSGGWGQGFGGYTLDQYDETRKKRIGGKHAGIFVRRVLETLGADDWEKLPGTPCRIRRDIVSGPIVAIGHFTDNKWFEPEVEFAAETSR
jgi:hypothetical protein